MKRIKLLSLLIFSIIFAYGQIEHSRVYSTFDNYPLSKSDTFNNGADLNGGLTHYQRIFSNQFDTIWSTWEGWALSNMSDDTSKGYSNQYSSITGSGLSNTTNYMVGYKNPVIVFNEPTLISGAYFTNSTYAYFDMLEGSNFSKKFGGDDGNDADFFLLHVYTYLEGNLVDSAELYLADYRFTDNRKDYILDDWTFLSFTEEPEGEVETDSIVFKFSSSDNGSWGMNTPAYFCMDDFNAIGSENHFYETATINQDEYYNGSDMSGGIVDQYLFFPNTYNQHWQTWEGWSLSAMYDDTTQGYQNQYSAMAISTNYKHFVSYGTYNEIRGPYLSEYDKNYLFKTAAPAPWPISIGITNSTYAYYDMLYGSNFSKKFGGVDGNDPDYFRVLLDYVDSKDSLLRTDTVYLADFRFSDNNEDYILDHWEYLEINEDPWSMHTQAHKIKFRMESSDNGSWGMNTPAYFCLSLDFDYGSSDNLNRKKFTFNLYPNPSSDLINIETSEEVLSVELIDMQGKLHLSSESTQLNVSELISGMYIVRLITKNGIATQRFIKL